MLHIFVFKTCIMVEWKDIPDYEKFYKINNHGTIISRRNDRELYGSVSTGGYLVVSLHKYGDCESFSIHHIMADVFLDRQEKSLNEKMVVIHKNNIKVDNRVGNLMLRTYSENLLIRAQERKDKKNEPHLAEIREVIEWYGKGEASIRGVMERIKRLSPLIK